MTLIIAEAGVNHNGCEKLAFDLIDIASESGADIVKFQIGKASRLVSKYAKQAKYQEINTGIIQSQKEMLETLEFDYKVHSRLANYCKLKKIEFLTSAFESQSLDYIINNIELKRLKIASGEITNAPFILQHARTGLDLIISTGMSNLQEVEDALSVIAFGLIAEKSEKPNSEAFRAAYSSNEGRSLLKQKVTVLHCTTDYPAKMSEVNLNAMDTLKEHFGLAVGYSDHTNGTHIAIAAAAKGAVVLEKHFTKNRRLLGPDHKASLEPDELFYMIKSIRDIESALGNGKKNPQSGESLNVEVARKSLVAAKPIKKGEIFNLDNLDIKRPGIGISPMRFWDILGKRAIRDFGEDEIVETK